MKMAHSLKNQRNKQTVYQNIP